MTNTQDTSKKSNTSHSKHTHWGALLLSFIGLLIALVALIAAGITWRQASNYQNRISQTQHANQALMMQLQHDQTEFQNTISEKITKNQTNLAQLMKQTSNISAESATLQAKYLIHLAKLNLYYQANASAALKLLQLAQHQLVNFHTSDIESLRQKIENDITTLSKTPTLNKQQLLSSLDDIATQVKRIPIIPGVLPQSELQLKDNAAQPNPWWTHIKKNLLKLKSFVIISKIDNPEAFAFTPESKLLTKQSILAKLIQAEWAVLNNQSEIYQQSLSGAKAMLKTIGLQKAAETALIEKINALQTAWSTPTTLIILTSDPMFTTQPQENKPTFKGEN